MNTKLIIEDTGLGVSLRGEPVPYRVWKTTDADGGLMLMLARSVFHDGALPPITPISHYVVMTNQEFATVQDRLDWIREQSATGRE